MSKDPKIPFVQVVWEDAWGTPVEDLSIKEVPDKHVACVKTTRGWLLLENEKGLSLSSERYCEEGEDRYVGRSFIPTKMIVSITPLRVSEQKKKKPHEDPQSSPSDPPAPD